ncbi:energy-coupling factor transporter ATPase [Olsenella sp. An290]|uniref:ABC transporter ATP-binding protein n=1 Tax=Olsenella sp. An290 TaxID=1965625 RepID=UPI000B36C32E|nr:energy-coupling factor transporter ATPase [Olsenella sp. An290]OUO35915.1 ABC transporter ATP-binding protein [Olsenella sp. An290]
MASGSTIICLDDVSFSYAGGADEGERALDHVSLSVCEGEFVGVIGPSGAGKSTLAALMSGAIPHHYRGSLFGTTLVDGVDTCNATLTDISRVVGSVAQDIDSQMVASVVEDELLFGLENFGVDHALIEGRVSAALEACGIASLRDREIATLSGGQKQKVAIAAILAMRPRVLVLDEPTAALDPASSTLVFETLRRLNREEGITIVVIEQKVALLSEFSDRILVMGDGRLELDGTPREVFSHGDELRRLGVDSPRVARVSNSLVQHGILPPTPPCLSVDEAAGLVAELVRGRTGRGANIAPFRAGSPHAPSPRPRAVDAEPCVSFRDVCFTYPGSGARVTDLTFDVYPGELVGIVGQNGAGKTTLTKLLNGLLRPSSGRIVVAGLDMADTPTSTIAAHVATLFQNPDRQICKDTVLDEIAFGLELTGVATDVARHRARAVAERFGLPPDEAPFSLSRGQRQMVALASVVVMEPEVVLLDEPTSGLDYRECMTVMETVREMADRGCAVIMVCHDMEVVSDFAERLLVMADGRILGQGETPEVFANVELMDRARVEPPQIIALSTMLARDVSREFAGVSQVSGIVDLVKELVSHD